SRRTLSARRLHRDEHEPPGRARGRVLQQARHVRAMDQGRQGRDQMDAAVVPDVRGQRRAAPTSCARLQSGQFLADAGDARADQGLVTDKLEGEADQDRRESREPRPLCRLPNGRGRHPTANVPGDFAAHRGTAAAATTSASMRRSTVMHSRATDGMSASERQGKRPDQAVKHRSDGWECREPSTLSHLGFQPVQKMPTIHVSSGFIWGIPVMETKGHARGARRVEGTGITDLRPLADSLDTYARQIHSIAEIVRVQLEMLEARSIEEESAEQSTEAKAAENTAPCSPHDGQQHLTSTLPAVGRRPLPVDGKLLLAPKVIAAVIGIIGIPLLAFSFGQIKPLGSAAHLAIQNQKGLTIERLPLGISVADGSGGETVTVGGLAEGTELSFGTALGSGNWLVPVADLDKTFVGAPVSFVGVMTAKVTLNSATGKRLDTRDVRFEWSTPEPYSAPPAEQTEPT